MDFSYVCLTIFAQKTTHSLYSLSVFPLIRKDLTDHHRCPCIFHFIPVALVISVVPFRSPHLRERRKSGSRSSCRQAPIGIPRRRVGSTQVTYVLQSRSSERAHEYATTWIVLLLKWRNNLSESGRLVRPIYRK